MNNETIKKVKSMNTKSIVAVAIILAVLGAGYALARPESNDSWGGMMGGSSYGNGMMEGYGETFNLRDLFYKDNLSPKILTRSYSSLNAK